MKIFLYPFLIITLLQSDFYSNETDAQELQGRAYYFSMSKLELGSWGARMSEAQKKQIKARLKNRLEKTYILNFSSEESLFVEEEKVDAISGATDSWGSNFARGKQYKNIAKNSLVQAQEFYGKRFLVKDELQAFDWKLGSETKEIGVTLVLRPQLLFPQKNFGGTTLNGVTYPIIRQTLLKKIFN